MTLSDIDLVMALAQQAHPGLPERRQTQVQRLRVFPRGCRVLGDAERVLGYAFSHPPSVTIDVRSFFVNI